MHSAVLLLVGLGLMQSGAAPSAGLHGYASAPPVSPTGYCYETQGNFTGVEPWSDPAVSGDDMVAGGCPTPWVTCRCCCWRSTGDFPGHVPYAAPYFGYYYFRPYNWSMVAEQQAIAAKWGGDPRIPYGQDVFERLYASLPVPEATPFDRNKIGRYPGEKKLPKLDDLLERKSDYDAPVSAPVAPSYDQ